MVNLIRLISEKDANFNAELDDGISINPNASIALQNLTFETDFDVLDIGGQDVDVTFQWDGADVSNDEQAGYLVPRTYTKTDYADFYPDLQRALNATQLTGNDGNNPAGIQDCYANFKVTNAGDKPIIEYKYAPMCQFFHMNSGPARDNSAITQIQAINQLDSGAAGNIFASLEYASNATPYNAGNLQKNTAGDLNGNSDALNCFTVGIGDKGYISKGNGMVMCNVNNVLDVALDSADKLGFGIGLSFTDISLDSDIIRNHEIPTSARNFEIRIKRPTDNYFFCSPDTGAGVLEASTITPFKMNITADPDPRTHDLLFIEKRNDTIIGRVGSLADGTPGTGVSNLLFIVQLTEEEQMKNLYPYIYMCGSATNATAGLPVCVIDSLQLGNERFEITGNSNYLVDGTTTAISIYETAYTTQVVMPFINPDRMTENFLAESSIIQIPKKVASFMGWSDNYIAAHLSTPGGQPFLKFKAPDTYIYVEFYLQFNLIPDSISSLTQSDNFVVILDSNPLLSYDASQFSYDDNDSQPTTNYNQMKGRRLNILATIPVNDNNGVVEFDSNELVYIDFDNKYPQEIKNLRLRVLNKNLEPILTNGKAVMTLLIKNNN
tara:strand:- start:4668 stop:6491 length:1824 start_codon:yes stop_codon:yes gene_type:complete